MERRSVDGLTLCFGAEERETVELIRQACVKSTQLLQQRWGLDTPEDCRFVIMTSWLSFMFQSTPWAWKVLLAVTLPVWAFRAWKTWPIAGGWEQGFGRTRAVGLKPPRLLQKRRQEDGGPVLRRK